MNKALFIRVEANQTIGIGHFMRTLALAEIWQLEYGQVYYLCYDLTSNLQSILNSKCIKFIQLQELSDIDEIHQISLLAKKYDAKWVVVDGYEFNEDYQQLIKTMGLRVLWVDEQGKLDKYEVDILLNHNLYALDHADSWYAKTPATTMLCLGASYTLIRSEFHSQTKEIKVCAEVVKNVLITLGGGEPQSRLLKLIVCVLLETDTQLLDICVLHDEPEWYGDLGNEGPLRHELKFIGHSTGVGQWMQWADLAITAGGSTSWEKLFMGLPSIVFNLFDNQDLIVEWLDKNSMAKVIPRGDSACSIESIKEVCMSYMQNIEQRHYIVKEGPRLVDGLGAQRICDLMTRLAN